MNFLSFRKAVFSLSLSGLLFALGSCDGRQHRVHGTNSMSEADLIAIYDREGYEEVFIVNPQGDEVAHYVLVSKDDSLVFDLPEDAVLIRTPISKSVIDSEVYASVFEELGSTGAITGLFDAGYVTSPDLQKLLKKNVIADVGQSVSPNEEKILSLEPDAIFVSYFDGMQTSGLDKLGAPVIKMYDLQETSPLGRAEWIRFIGLLLGKEEKSDSIFNSVKTNYRDLLASGNKAVHDSVKPKVLTELVYKGTWSVPGGKSYQARLIEDAGGNYFKSSDKSSVTLNLTPEQAISEGGDADIWLIRFYGDERQLASVIENDPLLKETKAYRTGNIYFSDTSESSLFREFPFHPDLLLKDYSVIFSNDSVTPLKYFRKLDKESATK